MGATQRDRGARRHRRPAAAHTTYASLVQRGDGSYQQCYDEQLELDLGVDMPAPRLIVTVPPETVDEMSSKVSTKSPHPLAELGRVLSQVLDFHTAFDLPRRPVPTAQVGEVLAQLRVRLLREEVEEFADATERRDLVAIADALADVVYVAYGSAITYGIDLDAVVEEVHRSNMSKLDEARRPVLREDGKVLKSARYRPPDVHAVLEGQLPLFDTDAVATSTSTVS